MVALAWGRVDSEEGSWESQDRRSGGQLASLCLAYPQPPGPIRAFPPLSPLDRLGQIAKISHASETRRLLENMRLDGVTV